MGRTIWKCVWSHRWCEDIVLCGTDACWFQNWFEDRRGERKRLKWFAGSFPLLHGMLRTAYSAQGLTLDGGVLVDFASCWWLGGWWLVARHICYADACPQTGKSHSTGHDWPSGGSFTQRATCLSSRIDWQIGKPKVLPRWSACRTGLCMSPWKTSWHLTLHLDSTACRRSDLLE